MKPDDDRATLAARVRAASLCAGYGGLELALGRAGIDVDLQWYAEIDPNASAVLAKRHPGVPNLGDITALDAYPDAPIDFLLAGFPCQTVSVAGKRTGDADERWLWPDVLRAIVATAPRRVLIENVRNLVSFDKGRLFNGICGDLNSAGYAVRYALVGACHVGAAHHRHRVFILAEHSDAPMVTRIDLPACAIPCGRGGQQLAATARDGDSRGAGDAAYWDSRRRARPRVGLPLNSAVALLPTPRATDGANGGPNQRGARGDLALPSAVIAARFDQYAPAVAHHVAVHGDAPPEPTEPNKNGAPRLAARFAEWLMCLPSGHVTDVLDRVPALKAIGNGVCPPQAAFAWHLLTERSCNVTAGTAELVGLARQRHDDQTRALIDAAGGNAAMARAVLMTLADALSAEAAAITAAKKKGYVGIARQWTDAAVRVRGVAVRLDPHMNASSESTVEPELAPADAATPDLLDATELLTVPPTEEATAVPAADPFTAPAIVVHHDMPPTPFTQPVAPVERLTWATYIERSATLPPAPESSYSQLTALAGCGMKYQLGRMSRHGLAAPERPSWALVGGNALHAAIADIERTALAGKSTMRIDIESTWAHHFTETIMAAADASGIDPNTWHASARGKEGYDWWRVEGAHMVARWIMLQTDERRARTRVANIGGAPAIELEYRWTVSGEIVSHGFMDSVWVDLTTAGLAVIDLKSGASGAPTDTIQLGEYGWALVDAFGVNPEQNPITAAYWLARTGEFSDPFDPLTRHPREELVYRHQAARAQKLAGAFLPNQSNFCGSCGMSAQCPARA